MKIFTVICYKPESEDFAYGHCVEAYPSDMKDGVFSTKEQVVDFITGLNGNIVSRGEALYEPTIRIFETDGVSIVEKTDDDYWLVSDIEDEAMKKAKILQKNLIEKQHRETELRLKKQKEEEELKQLQREKIQYEALKKKFEKVENAS